MVKNFYAKIGTMGMADSSRRRWSASGEEFQRRQQADVAAGEKFQEGGLSHIAPLNGSRGGDHTHACCPAA